MTGATRRGLFRRLRRTPSWPPPAPGHDPSKPAALPRRATSVRPVRYVVAHRRVDIDRIAEPVWFLEPELDS